MAANDIDERRDAGEMRERVRDLLPKLGHLHPRLEGEDSADVVEAIALLAEFQQQLKKQSQGADSDEASETGGR